MKKSNLVVLIVLIAMLMSSCQLASDGVRHGEDQLIGAFVTLGHFYDQLGEKYEERIYAKTRMTQYPGAKEEQEEFYFPGLEGYSMFAPELSDGEFQYIHFQASPAVRIDDFRQDYSDEMVDFYIEGTLTVDNSLLDTMILSANPVYQDGEGKIYVTSGSSAASNPSDPEGSVLSLSIFQTLTQTFGESKTDRSLRFKINVENQYTPTLYTFIPFDAQHQPLGKIELLPGAFPESITVDEEAEFFLLEVHKYNRSGQPMITRSFYEKDTEVLELMFSEDNGVFTVFPIDIK